MMHFDLRFLRLSSNYQVKEKIILSSLLIKADISKGLNFCC